MAEQRDEIIDRLDRLVELATVAVAPQLETTRNQLRQDPVTAAIFDVSAGDWVGSGDLQREVSKRTKKKPRTIRDHLADLLSRGLVQTRGDGPAKEYRSLSVLS